MRGNFFRVVKAAILRDMRTRFGRSYVSFLISIGWPLSHMGVMAGIYFFTHKLAPIGDDPAIFATTGIAPYIFCLYPARFTAMAIVQNKPLLQFMIVKPIHLILGRAVLEFLSAVVVFLIFTTTLWAVDFAVIPTDIYAAAAAIGATIILGLSLGIFGIVLISFNLLVGILAIVFSVLGMYFASGALLPPNIFPTKIKEWLSYDPLYHCIGLLRSSYYASYSAYDYSLTYVLYVSLCFLFLGLLGEFLMRGRVISY